MKKFFAEYIRIIAYTSLGLVFVLASFYLVINYQHSEEVAKKLYISSTESNYLSYKDKLAKIDNNLESFKTKKIDNKNIQRLYNKLLTCSNILKKDDGLANLKTNNYYTSYDIYKLGNNFQSQVLNVCWAVHLSYLSSDEVPEEFKEIAPYIPNTVDLASNQVLSALDEIENNSSYFYSTNITSATIRDYLSSDYTAIAKAYSGFADIVLNLSEFINNSEGGQDA